MTGRSRAAVGLLVITDLDGTLLDERTYRFDAAREALDALARERIPLVLATSKTQAEVMEIARRLPMVTAAIVENGGAVVVPADTASPFVGLGRPDGGTRVIELGVDRALLVRHLEAVANEAHVSLSGFSSLSAEQVAELTDLPLEAARLACERRYDEPFVMADQTALPRVVEAAGRRGLQVTRGGRFLHLTSAASDKGRALRALLALHTVNGRAFTTVGLGDSANDLPLLQAVDRPIIVPRPDGAPDPQLLGAAPGAERAPAPGPAGWNAAVLAILAGREWAGAGGGRP